MLFHMWSIAILGEKNSGLYLLKNGTFYSLCYCHVCPGKTDCQKLQGSVYPDLYKPPFSDQV